MTVFKWSQTAATNSTADGTINWAEGQSPSSVNNSARAMMAALAKFRDDISGNLVTGGTSSAYTLTTNQGFTSLSAMDNMTIAFRPHTANAAGATLNVDGLGAKTLRYTNGTSLLASELRGQTPYLANYDNGNSEWVVFGTQKNLPADTTIGGSAPDKFASGTTMLFRQASTPTGWTKDTTFNDRALRCVTGSPSNGGSFAFSTVFGGAYTPAGTVGGTGTVTVNRDGWSTDNALTAGRMLVNDGNTIIASDGSSVLGVVKAGSNQSFSVSISAATFTGTATNGGAGDPRVLYVDVYLASKD